MFRIVITTDDPEALLQTVNQKKLNVEREVKLQDMEHPQQVVVCDVDDFKSHPIRKFFQSLTISLMSVVVAASLLIFCCIFLFGLVSAFAQFGEISFYIIGGAFFSLMLWPLATRFITPKKVPIVATQEEIAPAQSPMAHQAA